MVDTITLRDGRRLGFADYGEPGQDPVIWSHGGPGSRLEPQGLAEAGRGSGFRLIGIDRPGYGHSDARPGRSIADWTCDALTLADHLELGRFYAVGVSTGGAYALALASVAPNRVIGAIACCALTDMRWREGRAMMLPATHAVWDAASRDDALRAAEDQFGADGSRMLSSLPPGLFPAADVAMLSDPAVAAGFAEGNAASFAQGVAGYVDDRLADGVGWGSFGVDAVACPVIVLHGDADPIVPLAHARHTARVVPGARLSTHADLGHFSIVSRLVGALEELRAAVLTP